MTNMKRLMIYTICTLTILLSGCFKDYEERYLFDENRLEFEDAVINGNASGKTFPILGPVPAEQGKATFRVNMTGEQSNRDRVLSFRIVPEETTAVDGRDFTLPHGNEFVIPANSSFGFIEVDLLPDGSGSPTLVLELLPQEDMKVLDRYHKIGLRFVYQFTKPDPDKLQQINDILLYNDFLIGAHANQNIGNFLDLNTLDVYVRAGAEANTEYIHFGLMNGASTGLNLLTPNSTGWSAWSGWGDIPNTWDPANSGELMKIVNPDQSELDLFDDATSVADLLTAYQYFAATITTRPGYNATNDGPSTRIRHIAPEEMVVYYSAEQQLVALLRVKSTVPANTGEMVVDIKTGKLTDPENHLNLQEMAIETLAGDLTSPRGLVNLADFSMYGLGDATSPTRRTSTDFAYIWSTATGTNFGNFMAMSASFGGWASINNLITADPPAGWAAAERNIGEFVHLENTTPDELLAAVRIKNRTEMIAAYEQAKIDVISRPDYDASFHGPGDRVRRMTPGSVIYFKSEAPGRESLYSVMIVRGLSTASNTNRMMELLIKSDLN